MARQTGFWSLVFISIVGLAIALTFPATALQAQPRATIEAQSRGVQQTAQSAALSVQQTAQGAALSAQQTVQAQTGGIQQTLEAGAQSLEQTVQAGAGSLQATLEAGLPAIQATAEYVATAINQQVGDIEATVTAISTTVQAALGNLPEEVSELLGYLAEQTSLSYDSETKLLTVTSYVTEEQANEVQDLVIEAAGYDPDAVSLDTRDDGTIVVTMIDVSGELPGIVVLTYQITVVDGHVTATLTGVTINGVSVPAERIPDDLQSAVQLGMLGSAMQTAVNVPADVPFVYTVQSVNVSDAGILIVYVMTLG
jgi:hypothetical protein